MACEHLVSTLGTYKVISSFFKFALFKCNVCRYSAVLEAMGSLEVVLPPSEAATSGREPGDEPNTCSHIDA